MILYVIGGIISCSWRVRCAFAAAASGESWKFSLENVRVLLLLVVGLSVLVLVWLVGLVTLLFWLLFALGLGV